MEYTFLGGLPRGNMTKHPFSMIRSHYLKRTSGGVGTFAVQIAKVLLAHHNAMVGSQLITKTKILSRMPTVIHFRT